MSIADGAQTQLPISPKPTARNFYPMLFPSYFPLLSTSLSEVLSSHSTEEKTEAQHSYLMVTLGELFYSPGSLNGPSGCLLLQLPRRKS